VRVQCGTDHPFTDLTDPLTIPFCRFTPPGCAGFDRSDPRFEADEAIQTHSLIEPYSTKLSPPFSFYWYKCKVIHQTK
jgi:hypothetical protein